MSLQGLRQENGMLSVIKTTQTMVKEMKMIRPLNLKVIKSSLCNYSNAYILLTGDITAIGGDADTRVAFKNCGPFTKCIIHINDEDTDGANNLDIIMPMYNLIQYSDNYSDTSGSLWHFKRVESPVTNAENPDNIFVDNSIFFKYKSSFLNH